MNELTFWGREQERDRERCTYSKLCAFITEFRAFCFCYWVLHLICSHIFFFSNQWWKWESIVFWHVIIFLRHICFHILWILLIWMFIFDLKILGFSGNFILMIWAWYLKNLFFLNWIKTCFVWLFKSVFLLSNSGPLFFFSQLRGPLYFSTFSWAHAYVYTASVWNKLASDAVKLHGSMFEQVEGKGLLCPFLEFYFKFIENQNEVKLACFSVLEWHFFFF